MADDLLELADRLWRGEASIVEHHPFAPTGRLVEVADGVAFVHSFANASAFATDEGLVMVDTGSFMLAGEVHRVVREWTDAQLHTAIWSHGHVDHVFGVDLWEADAGRAGAGAPTVVCHEAVPERHARYVRTAGINARINERQFQVPGLEWPTSFRKPDRTYRRELDLEVGGELFCLRHARGETDDHTWTWVPGRKVLCCGDFFIWAVPNAGNPQKAQRYAEEWVAALREMAGLGAEVLLPGHGLPVIGAERVATALGDTADLLEALTSAALAAMERGAPLDRVIREATAPPELLERPYLQPVYDDPEFVVRNLWRLHAGWWDGDPASLKPAPRADLASEIALLAGGAGRLAERARELAADGDLRLACHLAELAAAAAPDDRDCREIRIEVLEQRAQVEPSTMAKGVFASAARAAREA